MNKIALEIIKIDEIEKISDLISNKNKNEYKKNDDLIAATVQYAAKSGLRLVDLNLDKEEAVFAEEMFNKEEFSKFLNKMRRLFSDKKLSIIVRNGKKVHYTCDLSDESGKIMIWKV